MRRIPVVLAALLAAALTGCGSDDTSATGSGADATTAGETASRVESEPTVTAQAAPPTTTGADGCDHAAPIQTVPKTHDRPPPSPLVAGRRYEIRLDTSCGAIRVAVDARLGGPVAGAVAALVRERFYDGLRFHRVVPGFVLQGGDPSGDGSGGPGFSVVQAPPASYRYRTGDMAMAKTGTDPAGTAGSQFFLVSSAEGAAGLAQPGQPPLYAVVGHATDPASLATIARIDALGQGDGPPVEPVYIRRATLVDLGG